MALKLSAVEGRRKRNPVISELIDLYQFRYAKLTFRERFYTIKGL